METGHYVKCVGLTPIVFEGQLEKRLKTSGEFQICESYRPHPSEVFYQPPVNNRGIPRVRHFVNCVGLTPLLLCPNHIFPRLANFCQLSTFCQMCRSDPTGFPMSIMQI